MRLSLCEPDIPQNTGTLVRLAACMGVAVDVIEPCGFVFSDARMRRAGLDYLDSTESNSAAWFHGTSGLDVRCWLRLLKNYFGF